ncbi:hypothetical protein FEQ05_00694 [Burkholderia pseudomultivorans]|nr:hypothetical protein [Burkholderia pseudomultivorans]MDR8738814.1 hypothetical protein [Burkholderia pseudomultivorans]MDR8745718.1 hypothetical protein [Burkholderia pseudomultivorans]MDR8757618.1 hypothetical protein [Burkholderia pseudomultivorans]MDR8781711.1 hypothetical protein [Burkholderia pseudomultivorans]
MTQMVRVKGGKAAAAHAQSSVTPCGIVDAA